MINRIITELKKDIGITQSDYENYLEYKKLEDNIFDLENRKNIFMQEKNLIETQIKSINFVKRLFNSQQLRELKEKLNSLTENINYIELSINNAIEKKNSYIISEEYQNQIKAYIDLLKVEQNYNLGNINNVAEYFLKYFDSDFRNMLNYCKEKGIVIDFSLEKDSIFIEYFTKLNTKEWNMKIASLNDMMLVRKTDFFPSDDKIIAPIKIATKNYFLEQRLGNEIHNINIPLPIGHYTIHFAMNREVLPHQGAPEGWENCKTIILQPLTEELYQSALGLDALDTFYAGKVNLKDYYIICEDIESAQEITHKNNTATPIIVGKGNVNGFGNKILESMQIPCPFIYDDNKWLDETIPLNNYYDDKFLQTHPKLASYAPHAAMHPIHELAYDIPKIVTELELIEKISPEIAKCDSFEKAIHLINNDLFVKGTVYNFKLAKDNELNFKEMLQDKYKIYGEFLDYLTTLIDETEIDSQVIFEKMCEGLEINDLNIYQLKRIKECVINCVLASKKDTKEITTLNDRNGKLFANLFILYKIMRTDLMKIRCEDKSIYDVPFEQYDLKKHEEKIKSIFYSLVENEESLEIAAAKMYQMMYENAFNIPEFPLYKPESNDLQLRVDNIINNDNDDELNNLFKQNLQNSLNHLMLDNITKNGIYDINQIMINMILYEERASILSNNGSYDRNL